MIRPTIFATLALFLVGAATADRIISMPTAYTIQRGEAKVELMGFGEGLRYGWLRVDAQVLPFVEVQAYGLRMPGDRERFSLNAQYSILQPFPDLIPGVSVGALDITNDGDIGRSAYVALTFVSNVYSDWAEMERISLTLGAGFGGIGEGVFVGLHLPMFRRVAFIGEYDTRRITAGFDFEAIRDVGVRLVFRDGQPAIGLQFRNLF